MRAVLVANGMGLLFATTACQPRSFTDVDRAAIERVLANQVTAWNAGDLDGFMAGYQNSPDLIFTSSGNIRRGYEESRARYKQTYANGGNMGSLAFEVLDVRELGPNAALVLGKWVLTETEKAGHGVFTLVFQREPSGWRVVHDHTSANQE